MILGHQKQWQYLQRLAKLDKIPHALLFSGPEKAGKKTVALEFGKLLVKEPLRGENHPDLILVSPEEKEIKISQIRDLIWKLSLKPYSAPLKIAIIDEAQKMTGEAQNCFLKTLEEPKDKTLIILITEHPDSLLPTILSRCEMIKFYAVSKKEIEDYLKEKDLDSPKIKEILDVSLGLPGRAIEIFLNPQRLEEQKRGIEELNKFLNKDLSCRFQYAKDLSEENNLKEVLDIWQNYLRQSLISKIANNAENSYLVKLKNSLKQIQNISFLVETTNVNQRLALETLMLEM